MSDISAIIVMNFTGKKEEWSTWSEKFLSKSRLSGIKDVLLGKIIILRTNDEINEKADEGKIMMKIFDLKELAYTELIISIDVRTISSKVAWLKDERIKIIQKVMQPWLGKDCGTSVSLTQLLPW